MRFSVAHDVPFLAGTNLQISGTRPVTVTLHGEKYLTCPTAAASPSSTILTLEATISMPWSPASGRKVNEPLPRSATQPHAREFRRKRAALEIGSVVRWI
jgi:hypothetical protein